MGVEGVVSILGEEKVTIRVEVPCVKSSKLGSSISLTFKTVMPFFNSLKGLEG